LAVAAQQPREPDRPPAALRLLVGTLRASRSGGPSATSLGGTMAQRSELRCSHHASTKPIGMNVHQRLRHLAAAGALARRQCDSPRIWPISLRFGGLRRSSLRVRRFEPSESSAAFSPVSVRWFMRLPPNNRVNRTAHQRRCACWWVPFALRAPAAGYAERWAARWFSVFNFIVETRRRVSRST
jgi:hypothetical protein